MNIRLAFLALASEGLYLFLFESFELDLSRDRHELMQVGAWAALFLLYALAVRTVNGAGGARGKAKEASGLWLVLLASFVFRATGFPFAASAATALENPAQLLLTAAAYAGDITAMVLGLGLLRGLRLPAALIVIHGWNPLVVSLLRSVTPVEILAMAGVVAAFRLARAERLWSAAVVLGACLGGSIPVWALLPVMARVLRLRLLLTIALAAALWWHRGLPEIPEGYAGASLLPSLVTLTGLTLSRDPSFAWGLAAVAFLAVAALQAIRLEAKGTDLPARGLVSVGAFVFLAPFVEESWFVLVAYLATYARNRGWLALTATAPLTHFALGEGGYRFWIGFAQYFPAYASLIFSWLGRKKD